MLVDGREKKGRSRTKMAALPNSINGVFWSQFTRAGSRLTLRPIDGAGGEFFFQRRIKCVISLPPGVQMHPNKFWCAWLGQGGGLKAVWKGFGRSIKMKENFADLIFQNFCSKRPKNQLFAAVIFCTNLISGMYTVHTTIVTCAKPWGSCLTSRPATTRTLSSKSKRLRYNYCSKSAP